jgi:steroid delta-isomerase
MSIDVLRQAPETPARSAAIRSMELAMAGDGKAWLELFADDAVVQDPYGRSPMDPQGEGHRGKAAIEAFCASHIRPDSIRFEIRQTLSSGGACVCVGTITTRSPEGKVGWCEIVNAYEVNAEGKITLLRSYWDFEEMTRTVF